MRPQPCHRRRQGFTLVEVMVSLGIMTIGAMAVLAMQQQIIRGNMHARQLTTATQIAQNVIERLKIDSLSWTAAGLPPNTTIYLKNVTPAAIESRARKRCSAAAAITSAVMVGYS